MMALIPKVPIAHESMRPFKILLIACLAFSNDFVVCRQAEQRASRVDAAFPHLSDQPVHNLGLQQAEAVMSLHVVDNPVVEEVFFYHTIHYHTWLEKMH